MLFLNAENLQIQIKSIMLIKLLNCRKRTKTTIKTGMQREKYVYPRFA